MSYEALPLILALLLSIANVILWLIAKKDLNARAAEKHAPTVVELEKVRATVEELIDVLEERAVSSERRLSALVEEAHAILEHAVRVRQSSGLRLNDPAEPAPAPKPSKTRRPTTAKFEVVETMPSESTVDKSVAAPPEPSIALTTLEDGVELNNPEARVSDLYRQIYALADAGLEDIAEIAKRTGLGQAEVEMVLNLRDRGA